MIIEIFKFCMCWAVYTFCGAFFLWEAIKQWDANNRARFATFIMIAIYFAGKLFWL